MKHTTGKWLIDAAGNGQITIIDDSMLNRHIAYMPMDAMPEGEQEANACLIAAAPDLLEALQDMVSDRKSLSDATVEFALGTIAKATGVA